MSKDNNDMVYYRTKSGKLCVYEKIDNKKRTLKKYTNREKENISSKKIRITNNKKDIDRFAKEEANKSTGNNTLYIGKMNDEIADTLYEQAKINVKNYNVEIKGDIIRKIKKDHGEEEKEILRGQKAFTPNDYKYLKELVADPDNIFVDYNTIKNNKQITALTFKKIKPFKMESVHYISDKKKNVSLQTAYKHK